MLDAIRTALCCDPGIVQPPLRKIAVQWRDFGTDALLITIDVKIAAPLGSAKYYEIRERANFIISEAVFEAGAVFALPTRTSG